MHDITHIQIMNDLRIICIGDGPLDTWGGYIWFFFLGKLFYMSIPNNNKNSPFVDIFSLTCVVRTNFFS